MKFACPSCSGHIEAEEGWIGHTTDCPHCGASFVVPGPEPTEQPVQYQHSSTQGPPPLPPGPPPSSPPQLRPQPQPAAHRGQGEFAPCPRCGSYAAKKLKFTWWGGALGAKMFSHVKCQNCSQGYNGKSGQLNTTAITLYLVISGVIGLIFGVFLFAMMR